MVDGNDTQGVTGMNKILAGAAVLWLAIGTASTHAQTYSGQALDALYEHGLREMAPNWRGLGKTHEAAVFIHSEVRKTDNGRLAVWMHQELSAPEYIEKETSYLSTRDRMVVDCRTARIGKTDMAYYAERFAHGQVVWTSRKQAEMIEVVPDSIEELLVKVVCAPKLRIATPKTKTATPSKD